MRIFQQELAARRCHRHTAGQRLWRLCLAAVVAGLAACSGGGSDESPAAPAAGTAGILTVGPEAAVVDGVDGIQVAIPEGALTQPVTIRVARDSSGAPALDSAIKRASPIYALTPHGIEFAKPARVLVPFDPATSPGAGYEPVLHKASLGAAWVPQQAAVLAGNALAAEVSSFSYFVVLWCTSTRNDFLGWGQGGCARAGFDATLELADVAGTRPPMVLGGRLRPAEPAFVVTQPGNMNLTLRVAAAENGLVGVGPHTMRVRVLRGARQLVRELTLPFTGPFNYTINLPITEADNGEAYYWLELSCVLFADGKCGSSTAGSSIGSVRTLVAPYSQVPTNTLLIRVAIAPGTPVPPGLGPRFDLANTGFAVDYLSAARRVVTTWNFEPLAQMRTPGALVLKAATLDDASFEWEQSADGGLTWRPWPMYPNPLAVTPRGITRAFGVSDFTGFGNGLYYFEWQEFFTEQDLNGRKFRVRASNAFGSTLSPVFTIDAPPSPVPPVWTQQPPATITVTAGQTASISVVASGSPAPQIGWQTRAPGEVAWIDIASVSGGTLTTALLQLADSGRQFRALASNSASPTPIVSDTTTIAVTPAPVAPTITTQPASLNVVAGSEAVFAVAARGTEALSYQWARNGSPIAGANAPMLKLNAVGAGDAGSYAVTISNVAGTLTSNAATLTVTPVGVAPPVAPTIVTEPSSVTVNAGNTATFGVGVNGSGPFTYQWRKGGTPIAGATSAVHTIAAAATEDAGSYSVVVANSVGSATSASATLTVLAAPAAVAPTLSTQPSTLTVVPGTTATFAVAASGSGPLGYQWLRSGSAIAGATGPVLTITGTSGVNAGSYSVVVSNTAGSVTSTAAQLIVIGAPAITVPPAGRTVTAGQTATFGVTATGDLVRYQWTRNGLAIPGASESSYTTPATTLADSGAVYGVVAYNNAGIAFSAGAVLTVTPPSGTLSLYAGSPSTFGSADGDVSVARFNNIYGVALGSGGDLFAWEAIGGAMRLRKITPAQQVSTLAIESTLVGSVGSAARITATASGGVVTAISSVDGLGNRVVEIVRFEADGTMSRLTVTGLPAVPPDVSLHWDGPVVEDGAGGYYAALLFGEIGRVSAGGAYAPFAGAAGQAGAVNANGTSARFGLQLGGLARDASGNLIVADVENQLIRKISPAGDVSTFAGTPYAQGWVDGTANLALFSSPWNVALDAAGNAYVTEIGNCSLRKVTPTGQVSTVVGTRSVPCSFAPGSPGVLSGSTYGVTVNAAGTRAYIGLQFAIAAVDIP